MIRLGVVGFGHIGRIHCQAAKDAPEVELAAIATSRPEEVRNAFGRDVSVFTNYADLLRSARVDGVVVCVPTFLHEQVVLDAVGQGLPVLCEKPFALDLAAAERMLDAAHRSRVCLMIAHVLRFWPSYVRIKQLVAEGVIGSIQAISASRLAMYPPWGDWFRDPGKSGGAILDMQVHDADFVYWLLGLPAEVYAAGIQSDAGSWDQVTTILRYPGAVATVESTYLMPDSRPFTCGIRVTGSGGCLEFSFRVAGNVEKREQAVSSLLLHTNGNASTELVVSTEDMYTAQLQYFADCIAQKRSPTWCPPEESLEVMRIMRACTQSLSTRTPIHL